jgi:hypothetical protein
MSFDKDTSFEEIIKLKNQMQGELDQQLGTCMVNIIAESN